MCDLAPRLRPAPLSPSWTKRQFVPPKRDALKRTLRAIVVERQASLVEEDAEVVPLVVDVADSSGNGALGRMTVALRIEPTPASARGSGRHAVSETPTLRLRPNPARRLRGSRRPSGSFLRLRVAATVPSVVSRNQDGRDSRSTRREPAARRRSGSGIRRWMPLARHSGSPSTRTTSRASGSWPRTTSSR